jgi:hypothetical protein
MIYVNKFGILKIADDADHETADRESSIDLLNDREVY